MIRLSCSRTINVFAHALWGEECGIGLGVEPVGAPPLTMAFPALSVQVGESGSAWKTRIHFRILVMYRRNAKPDLRGKHRSKWKENKLVIVLKFINFNYKMLLVKYYRFWGLSLLLLTYMPPLFLLSNVYIDIVFLLSVYPPIPAYQG